MRIQCLCRAGCSHKLTRSCSLTVPNSAQREQTIHIYPRGPATASRSQSCSAKESPLQSQHNTKMEFVPSPSLMNAHYSSSPYSSIYDQEKPDIWSAICRAGNPNMDSTSTDDLNVLDDKLEDSTLETLLTSDVIHSLQSATLPISADFQWGGKPDPVISVSQSSDSIGINPTLTQLNMDPDMSIVNDILNMDSDENSTFDAFGSASNSPFNALSSEVSKNANSFGTTTATSQTRFSAKIVQAPLSMDRQKATELLNSNFLRSNRDNFPPRGSQQPPVGVVAPVKKEEEGVFPNDSIKKEKEITKAEVHTPNLHKLLKSSNSEAGSKAKVAINQKENAAQIVPLSTDSLSKDVIKSEPMSPEKSPSKRSLVKEESTEEMWKDIENFIYSPSPEPPSKKRKRNNSGSSAHMSDEEDEDDDDDRSLYGGKDYEDDSDDDYSDIDADLTRISPSECESLVVTGKKQKQFFWQYNVQSKGPKGTRLKLAVDGPSDPHVLNDFEDPVFDEGNTMVAGIRHGGKARKGDGNEITPNPKKLFMIGHQLLRLNGQINAFQLGPDIPLAQRNESKKEKNKLASRACRLKKKAQHEANKIKLFGLEKEHNQLNQVLKFIWPLLRDRAKTLMGGSSDKMAVGPECLSNKLEKYMMDVLNEKIAGHTVDFVNSVILRVESGDSAGGLNTKKKLKS